MDEEMSIGNLSNRSTRDPRSPASVYLCSLCNKPFINESSRHRHVRYCGSRTRKRPRSCRACNAAKIKCSFETPCTRCTKKGIECIYGTPAVEMRALPLPPRAAQSLPLTDGIFSGTNVSFTDELAKDDVDLQFLSNNSQTSVGLGSQTLSFNESFMIDGILGFEDYNSSPIQFSSDVSLSPYTKKDQDLPSWCTWSNGSVSLSVVTENPTIGTDSSLLAILQMERPHAQHNANLIIQALRSFPTMMLRRESFPWFIHPNSNLLAKPRSGTLPQALSTCMSISQMFSSRTPETKSFLWGTIGSEYRRFDNEKHCMDPFELLAATQASMIYLVMCIIDQSPESEAIALELLVTLYDLYMLGKKISACAILRSEVSSPSLNWEDWIFAESQRRLAHLWFLIGCVVCIKTGIPCDTSQSYRYLPLPGLKSLWEARSQSAWESEYEASHYLQKSGLANLGDLIDAQKSDYSPLNAQKLDRWNAGVDNLGSLLNLVSTMV